MKLENIIKLEPGTQLRLTRSGILNHYDWLVNRGLLDKKIIGIYEEWALAFGAWRIRFRNGSTRYFKMGEFDFVNLETRGHPLTNIFKLDIVANK